MNYSTTVRQVQRATALLVALGLSSTALAGPGYGKNKGRGHQPEHFTVQARVVDVEPLVRIVQITTPQEVCWEEPVRHSAGGYESATPKVLGSILGGVAGNQFGGGTGNKIMTVAGVVLGASIGRDIAYENRRDARSYVSYEEVCEVEQVTHEEERTDGYRVTYEYAGREFVTRTATDPGATIRVRVGVQPLRQDAYQGVY